MSPALEATTALPLPLPSLPLLLQAKSYIEAVEAEDSESMLVKGVDLVMTMSGTQVRPCARTDNGVAWQARRRDSS